MANLSLVLTYWVF